jgi:hypothetical protein
VLPTRRSAVSGLGLGNRLANRKPQTRKNARNYKQLDWRSGRDANPRLSNTINNLLYPKEGEPLSTPMIPEFRTRFRTTYARPRAAT